MSQIAVPARTGYTVIPNGILPEGRISARAWGLYAYLMSRPPGWIVRVKQLQSIFTEGREAIYTAIRELVGVGLMRKIQCQDNGVPCSRFELAPPDESPASPISQDRPNTDSWDTGSRDTGSRDPSHYGEVATTDSSQTRGVTSRSVPTETSTQVTSAISDRGDSQEIATINRRDDVERLCVHLADRIEQNGCKRPTISKSWRDAARLMLDRDGRTERQVHAAIDWCQDHAFWCSNVLSMPKLRQQYERLRLQAQEQRNGNSNGHRPSTTDDRVQQALVLATEYAERGE